MDYLAEIIVKFQSNPKVQSDMKFHQKWVEEWLQLEWKATFPLTGGGGATGMGKDRMGLDWSRKW